MEIISCFIFALRVFFCLSHACNALQYLQWLNQRKTRLLNDVLLVAFFCASIGLNVVISLRPVAAGGNQGFPFDAIQCRPPLAGFPTYIQTHTEIALVFYAPRCFPHIPYLEVAQHGNHHENVNNRKNRVIISVYILGNDCIYHWSIPYYCATLIHSAKKDAPPTLLSPLQLCHPWAEFWG